MDLNQFNGHIGIQVKDVQLAQAFYNKLGFKTEAEYRVPNDEGSDNQICFVSYSGTLIELYQLHAQPQASGDGYVDHFSVVENDFSALQTRLKELDIPIIDGPTRLPFGEKGMEYLMVRGPNNEKIEFDHIFS